jgi:hypothetical protein
MKGKYFTVEIKPQFSPLTAGMHAAFSDGDVLFDWTPFDMPRGCSKLIGAHLEIRPRGNADVDPNIFALELLFSKSHTKVGSVPKAPGTLGPVNSAPATPTQINSNTEGFIGQIKIVAGDFAATDPLACASTAAPEGIIIEGDEKLRGGVGYNAFDKIYIAGIAGGAIDLRSLTRINAGDLDGPTYTVNGTDPRLHFAPGDTLYATASGGASQLITGTVSTLTNATTIVMSSAGVALSNTDFIYNVYPMRIVLAFEK